MVYDKTLTKEDVVADCTQPKGFKEAFQSLQAVPAGPDSEETDVSNGKLDVSCQLKQRRAEPPTTRTEEEVFVEQEIFGPSIMVKYKAKFGALPPDDVEDVVTSNQLGDVAAHPGYLFWTYKRVLHDDHAYQACGHICSQERGIILHRKVEPGGTNNEEEENELAE